MSAQAPDADLLLFLNQVHPGAAGSKLSGDSAAALKPGEHDCGTASSGVSLPTLLPGLSSIPVPPAAFPALPLPPQLLTRAFSSAHIPLPPTAPLQRQKSGSVEWRTFMTIEDRQSVRAQIRAAYTANCASYEELLDAAVAVEEELLHMSAPSRLDYFKHAIGYDTRLKLKRKQLVGRGKDSLPDPATGTPGCAAAAALPAAAAAALPAPAAAVVSSSVAVGSAAGASASSGAGVASAGAAPGSGAVAFTLDNSASGPVGAGADGHASFEAVAGGEGAVKRSRVL